MRISGFTTIRPNMAETRTYEDFMKFLGAKPARLGLVSTLYDQYTITHLTEALQNIYTKGKPKNGFKSIDSFVVEWDIQVKRIKRIPILRVEGDGCNGSDILFYFPENYYQKFDTFIIEKTRDLIIVMNRPQRIRDNEFLVIGKINDSEYDSAINPEAIVNTMTRFVTNYMPELHEEGYTKYQSNCEKHRSFIATHRNDIDLSAMYKPLEDVFIQIGEGKDGGKDDPVFVLKKAEEQVIENYLEARDMDLVWGKSNVDIHGKPKIYDDETGRPVISGDGLIAQLERFATKFVFSKLTTAYFKKALATMVAKSVKATGNDYLFLVNTKLWNEINTVLDRWLVEHKTDGTVLYSKAANGYVELGATYHSYEFSGNKIIFKVERTFDVEYPTRDYGVMVDLTADGISNKPAMEMLTFKNGQFIHNWIVGVGGKDGLSSGEVSSRVAGSHIVAWGYAGLAMYNPYRSVIFLGQDTGAPLF